MTDKKEVFHKIMDLAEKAALNNNTVNEEDETMNENNTCTNNETNETSVRGDVVKIVLTVVSSLTTIAGAVINFHAKKVASANYKYRCDTLVKAVEAGADSSTMYQLFRDRSLIERIFGDKKN